MLEVAKNIGHFNDEITWPAQRAWNSGKSTTLCEIRRPCWSRSIRVGFRPIAEFYLRGHIRPSRRRVSSADGQQWRSVTSSFGSHNERFRPLNTSFPCTSWHILDHAWCSVIVHAPGTQMGKRATGCCRTWDQKLSSGLLLTFMSTHFRFAETRN